MLAIYFFSFPLSLGCEAVEGGLARSELSGTENTAKDGEAAREKEPGSWVTLCDRTAWPALDWLPDFGLLHEEYINL